ncbi:MAG: alpha/beta fold hydrolase [Candidatus Woesearchaeota archaeon]
MKVLEKGFLDRGSHKLYFELCGNPDGEPWIYLHGGPGSYFSDKVKRFFGDDKKVLFFNQRGSPGNKYVDVLKDNNTDFLVSDILAFMDKFGFEKVKIFGSSFGSFLALVFAIRYPERVSRLVLNGVFLGSKSEINRIFDGSLNDFYPDVFEYVDSRVKVDEDFVSTVFEGMKTDERMFYYKMFFLAEAIGYSEDNTLSGALDYLDGLSFDDSFLLAPFYFLNECFIPDNYILDTASSISCPVSIVHARQDFMCIPRFAFELSNKLKNFDLYFVKGAHSKYSGDVFEKLREVINK